VIKLFIASLQILRRHSRPSPWHGWRQYNRLTAGTRASRRGSRALDSTVYRFRNCGICRQCQSQTIYIKVRWSLWASASRGRTLGDRRRICRREGLVRSRVYV